MAELEAGLFKKIAEVMGEVDRIPKRGRNTFHNYDYVTEADLVEAVRSKLAERNVALIPALAGVEEREYTTSKGNESIVTTARMTFTFVDGDSGAMFKADWAGQGDDPADKGLYSAYTGGLKYFLMKTFLIPTGDDPESRTETDQRAGSRQPAKAKPEVRNPGEPATDPQKRKARQMLKGRTPKELAGVLSEITGLELAASKAAIESAVNGFTKGQASAFIDRMQNTLPKSEEHPSDVDNSGFEPPENQPSLDDVLAEGDAGLEKAA